MSFVALNLVVILAIGLCVLVVRFVRHRSDRAEPPSSTAADPAEQELTDAVTEWARVTGLLTADNGRDESAGDRGG